METPKLSPQRAVALLRGGQALFVAALAWGAASDHGSAAAALRLAEWAQAAPDAWQPALQGFIDMVTLHHRTLGVLLLLSASVHALEAWGLWQGRRWADALVATSVAALLPLELAALWHHATPTRVLLLLANLALVAWLASRLFKRQGGAST